MESEEFYDSLDEGSDYENCSPPPEENEFLSTLNFPASDKEDLIPFYEGNLSVSQIHLNKSFSQCSGFLSQNRNTSPLYNKKFLSNTKKSKSRSKISITPSSKPKKSYLEMFYDRTGKNKYELNEFNCDSARPTCSNSSPKSYITCMGNDECDNITTVDLKSDSEVSSENKETSSRQVPKLDLQMDSGDHKFYNAYEQNLDNFSCPPHSNFRYTAKMPSISMATKGTDTRTEKLDIVYSKLEIWKRRQQYGMRASESNRIKMQEKKALQVLEKEAKTNKICI